MPAIVIDHVTMKFNMSRERIDNMKEYFIKLIKRQLFYEEFTALSDVSAVIEPGEIFGIVGLNGSGKSTLLKLVSGILKPTVGHVVTNGTISPLIELGAGFDFEMTARENLFMNGSVLGYPRDFMRERFDEIIAFAELKAFVDVPLKNFSSGMVARLGFSIATLVKPEILIVDEILAVGDFLFQQKCEKRIQEMMAGGTTVLIVSHSVDQIERLCGRVMWLEKGKVRMVGGTKEVCCMYRNGQSQ